ncbi:hypothetical protein ELI24_32075 (plasmid) [Rhizobium ruizarguesonis]|uniref:Uncharacterized protein n=2 Tax=Rhizobium TaxID=379 RepID=A0A7M3DJH3_RHILE|nr:hypothetical protein ELI50_32295 [Rhizobium leguminosarum]TAU15648.1 hypothetical protein ELI48_32115 [Rhizobium ruizarguesonis]TBE59149.1 hypothetical protein ELH03_33935 [Rhizobium beringeri]TAU35424.1 hypothetical protein ELI43_36455 [Rhizobium leguminosarum]TAU37409.1 hypothetical protein ELI42_35020 [Rhizobium ruizarguesonis]
MDRFFVVVVFEGVVDISPDNPPCGIYLTDCDLIASLCRRAHNVADTAFQAQHRVHHRHLYGGAVFASKHDGGYAVSKFLSFDTNDVMEEVHDNWTAVHIRFDNCGTWRIHTVFVRCLDGATDGFR